MSDLTKDTPRTEWLSTMGLHSLAKNYQRKLDEANEYARKANEAKRLATAAESALEEVKLRIAQEVVIQGSPLVLPLDQKDMSFVRASLDSGYSPTPSNVRITIEKIPQ